MQQQPSKLIPYLIILLGLVGGYYFHAQTGGGFVPPVLLQESRDDIRALKNIRIDFTLLEKPEYKNLRFYAEFPITPGFPGKYDPFSN